MPMSGMKSLLYFSTNVYFLWMMRYAPWFTWTIVSGYQIDSHFAELFSGALQWPYYFWHQRSFFSIELGIELLAAFAIDNWIHLLLVVLLFCFTFLWWLSWLDSHQGLICFMFSNLISSIWCCMLDWHLDVYLSKVFDDFCNSGGIIVFSAQFLT